MGVQKMMEEAEGLEGTWQNIWGVKDVLKFVDVDRCK